MSNPSATWTKNEWYDCTIQSKSDGGYIIVSSTTALLFETEDTLKIVEKKKDDQSAPKRVIRGDEFVEFEVLGRCRFLAEGADKANSQKANKSGPRAYARLQEEMVGTKVDGKTYISAAYLGFAMSMQGPVFMRREIQKSSRLSKDDSEEENEDTPGSNRGKKNSSKKEKPNRSKVVPSGPTHEEALKFNLKGVNLRSEPAFTITGQDVIPHYMMTTKVNLGMAKKLVSGTPLEFFCTSSEERKAYSEYALAQIENLKNGRAISPLCCISLHSAPEVVPGSILTGMLQNNNLPSGDSNRPLSEVTCNTEVLFRTTFDDEPTGFHYAAAYTEALEYPPKLLRLLRDFALLHPKDLLPTSIMLLACHLWVDIMDHPDMRLEWFMRNKRNEGKVYQGVHSSYTFLIGCGGQSGWGSLNTHIPLDLSLKRPNLTNLIWDYLRT